MDLSPGAVDSKVRDITVKRFFEIVEFGKILQPGVIVFHSGYYRWKYCNRVDIWLEESLKTWIAVNEKASDVGIKVAIENIFEEEPSNLKLLAEKMNSQNFGICFDTGHFNLFSKIELSDWLSMIKPYVIELHLHDNNKSDDSHVAIGDGSFDFRTLFNELKGRDIVYTIEAHTEEGVKKSIERLKSFLKTD
jgi:sugar phosphate isomerase/epimerase